MPLVLILENFSLDQNSHANFVHYIIVKKNDELASECARVCIPHLFWMGFQPVLGILRPKLAAACLNGILRPSTRICCCACSAFCRLVDGRDTSSHRAAGRPLAAPASAALVSSVHHAAGHELRRRSATSSSGSATGQTLLLLEELIIICRLQQEVQRAAGPWCLVVCSSWDSVRAQGGSGWCVD